jgi:hypothetical protein
MGAVASQPTELYALLHMQPVCGNLLGKRV